MGENLFVDEDPVDETYARRLRRRLLSWYRANARDLPWRRTRDPYAIWVSEVMLQQTQVATVIPYYERFLQRFPTLSALAAADEAAVLETWAGLGYYSRARGLLHGAREVIEKWGGALPRRREELLRLPGVGPYTASAIASLAFGRPEAVLDGNVIRVLCRLFALRGDPAAGPLRRRLWALAGQLVSPTAPADFNSAMMELGATVCRPGRPDCHRCPVEPLCAARALGIEEELPEIPKAGPPVPVQMAAAVISSAGGTLLVRRGDERRWAGMWSFPVVEVAASADPRTTLAQHVRDRLGLAVRAGEAVAVIRHAVTRFTITLTAYRCEVESGTPAARGYLEWGWFNEEELACVGLPSPHRRLAGLLVRKDREAAQLELSYTG
jgi:A/G-specific adenine glycosylase